MDARTLCLGIINEAPASGYDIKKAVEEGPFQHFFGISFGSIYPTLNRLLEDGHIVTVEETDAPGGHPSKRRFTTTNQGKAEFCEQLAAFDARDKMRSEFVLALYFFNELDLATRIAMLDKRLAYLRNDLDEISCRADEAICEGLMADKEAILGFAHSVRSAEMNYLSNYRDKLAGRLTQGLATAVAQDPSNELPMPLNGAKEAQPNAPTELETI